MTWATRIGVSITVVMLASSPVWAAKREHLGDYRDWSTFMDIEDNGTRVCYMTSVPKSSKLSQNSAKRDKPYVMVAHWPGRGQRGIVSIGGGTDYRANADVVLTIGDDSFELYGEKDVAWTYDVKDDARIVDAMKAGINMTVKSVSARGFSVTDGYSLHGFTAAFNRINEACK